MDAFGERLEGGRDAHGCVGGVALASGVPVGAPEDEGVEANVTRLRHIVDTPWFVMAPWARGLRLRPHSRWGSAMTRATRRDERGACGVEGPCGVPNT